MAIWPRTGRGRRAGTHGSVFGACERKTTGKHPNDWKEWITVKDRSPPWTFKSFRRKVSLIVGSLFNEPMLVETLRPGGVAVWTVGLAGSRTHRFLRVQLSETILDFSGSLNPPGPSTEIPNCSSCRRPHDERTRQADRVHASCAGPLRTTGNHGNGCHGGDPHRETGAGTARPVAVPAQSSNTSANGPASSTLCNRWLRWWTKRSAGWWW